MIHQAREEDATTCHRWLVTHRDGQRIEFLPTQPEYGEHLAQPAGHFQKHITAPDQRINVQRPPT